MAKRTKRTTTSVSITPTSTQTARTEFNPDYTYVKRDLARIGTLAGFFIVVLVALSFFLR
ncbi:MAG TPA: hypothetical protein VFY83_02445 [Anaerolineales bacterium]|jgi:hypothetical protein|nr:hypothetical protein [Anaerolineales bacterium]